MKSLYPQKTLPEVGFVGRGVSRHRPRNAPELYGGPYPFVQTADVKAGSLFVGEVTQSYNDQGLAQSKLWPAGTLLITLAGNIAETAILDRPACFPDSIMGFIPREGEADVCFVKYAVEAAKERLLALAQGAAQANLSQAKLEALRFPMPAYEEQRKIAAVLSAYDEQMAVQTRRVVLLEQIAEELYQEWFLRFRFPGWKEEKTEQKRPEGWSRRPLSDLFQIGCGGTPATNHAAFWGGDMPFFTPRDAPKECYVLETAQTLTTQGLEKVRSPLYPRNTLLLTARGTVGKVCLAHRPMAINQSCYALTPQMKGPVAWHFCALKQAVPRLQAASHSGLFDHILLDSFDKVAIPWPGEALVHEFNEVAHPLFEQAALLLESNLHLRNTRNLLLPRVLSGALSLAHLPL